MAAYERVVQRPEHGITHAARGNKLMELKEGKQYNAFLLSGK